MHQVQAHIIENKHLIQNHRVICWGRQVGNGRRRWRYTLQRADSYPRSFLVEENGVSCGRLSLAHQHSHVHAHAPTCPCRYSLCSIFPSYRCEASSFCAVRWRLRFEPPSDSLYRRVRCARLAVSVSLEPAREVACKDCTAPAFFSVRAMFSLSSF